MNTTQASQKTEKEMCFVPFGAVDKIRLTMSIIQNIVAVPTKSGKTCSERDALRFMMLCQAQRLNPFAGDAFLVGYDTQSGPVFSLITAHQAFLKRAETSEDFDGMTSGVLVRGENDTVIEREGDFHLPDEIIVGGWARVFHKKRSHPTYRRIRMERFNNGYAQWKVDPAGMIVKCSEGDALRSTFPTLLGGLYLKEELEATVAATLPSVSAVDVSRVPSEATANQIEAAGKTTKISPQAELEALVVSAGFTFDALRVWGEETGNIEGADSLASFADLPMDVCRRLLRAQKGLLMGLATTKGGDK